MKLKSFSVQELGPSHHPVIVLPGVEFADLCALVTFMYSGEVNIYESQLASLLSMADVLHIRGLADFSNVSILTFILVVYILTSW